MVTPGLNSTPRWTAVFLVLILAAALTAAQKVYVYEVESDVAVSFEKAPHVPGMSWRFGEQALVIFVPKDVGPGLFLFTNETAPVPVYDRSYFLLVVPAEARPSRSARAEAFLRTPDGVYPVVFRKPDRGIVDITARSKEEALAILKQLGLEPEFRGRAGLKRTIEKGPTDAATVASTSLGSTLDVYGGLYFKQTAVTRTGTIIIPVHGNEPPCVNLPYAAYVGYDARSLMVGTLIRGGTVDADLVVEVYKIRGGQCEYLGLRSFRLANKTRYWVDLVNPASSVDQLAVFIYLNVRSFAGRPKVGVNASVLYTRTYRYGFEVGEFAARATGSSGYSVNNYVRRIVIGPYVAYDGYIAGTTSSSLSLTISTDPINGVCKDMLVKSYINGRSWSGTAAYKGAYNGYVCIYEVSPSFSQADFEFEYSYAKTFGGGLFWVLDISYIDGSTPYVRAIYLRDGDAFRYRRWAEQWKTVPTGIDSNWADPFLSSAVELYAAPTEPSAAPGIYHGLVTIRANAAGQYLGRVVLTISGRYIYPGLNSAVHISKAEIELSMPLSVQGVDAVGESYLMPDYQLNPITPPQWVEIALRIKDAVDFLLTITGAGGRALSLLMFVVGKGLESAGDSVRVQPLDYSTVRITYQRGWDTYVDSDTVIAPLKIPSLAGRLSPTELAIKQVCLDGFCVKPDLKAYVQPDAGYGIDVHVDVKNWMFRGQVLSKMTYETGIG